MSCQLKWQVYSNDIIFDFVYQLAHSDRNKWKSIVVRYVLYILILEVSVNRWETYIIMTTFQTYAAFLQHITNFDPPRVSSEVSAQMSWV